MKLPQLIDVWSAEVPLKPGIERLVRNATPTARRFVFDSEACGHVGNLLFHAGDLVAEQIAFAKPPYPNTYVEITDARAMFKAWRPATTEAQALNSDDRLGILYTGDRLYTFVSGVTKGPVLGMFSITTGHGQTAPLTSIFGQPRYWSPEHVKLSYLLGGMRQNDGTIAMLRADYQWFLDNYDLASTLADTWSGDRSRREKVMADSAFLGGGDLIIGAACLLLIHGKRRGVTIREVPHERGWFKSKRVVYKSHSVVTIKLGPHDSIRRLAFGSRESPARHDVLGTWVDYHRDRQCAHDWYRLEDNDHERYRCTKCPTLRTWRNPHVRGDGLKGIVTKTYEVIK